MQFACFDDEIDVSINNKRGFDARACANINEESAEEAGTDLLLFIVLNAF